MKFRQPPAPTIYFPAAVTYTAATLRLLFTSSFKTSTPFARTPHRFLRFLLQSFGLLSPPPPAHYRPPARLSAFDFACFGRRAAARFPRRAPLAPARFASPPPCSAAPFVAASSPPCAAPVGLDLVPLSLRCCCHRSVLAGLASLAPTILSLSRRLAPTPPSALVLCLARCQSSLVAPGAAVGFDFVTA